MAVNYLSSIIFGIAELNTEKGSRNLYPDDQFPTRKPGMVNSCVFYMHRKPPGHEWWLTCDKKSPGRERKGLRNLSSACVHGLLRLYSDEWPVSEDFTLNFT